jgi:hypothetical protein
MDTSLQTSRIWSRVAKDIVFMLRLLRFGEEWPFLSYAEAELHSCFVRTVHYAGAPSLSS